jgi:hypothetical protein
MIGSTTFEGCSWSLAFEESWPLVTIALTGARRLGDQAPSTA